MTHRFILYAGGNNLLTVSYVIGPLTQSTKYLWAGGFELIQGDLLGDLLRCPGYGSSLRAVRETVRDLKKGIYKRILFNNKTMSMANKYKNDIIMFEVNLNIYIFINYNA